jgi:hypothetical protein
VPQVWWSGIRNIITNHVNHGLVFVLKLTRLNN